MNACPNFRWHSTSWAIAWLIEQRKDKPRSEPWFASYCLCLLCVFYTFAFCSFTMTSGGSKCGLCRIPSQQILERIAGYPSPFLSLLNIWWNHLLQEPGSPHPLTTITAQITRHILICPSRWKKCIRHCSTLQLQISHSLKRKSCDGTNFGGPYNYSPCVT